MVNWKTTLFGAVSALAQYAKTAFPEYGSIMDGVAALALALMGYFATDKR